MSSYKRFEGTPMSWQYFTCFWVSGRSGFFVASTMNNFLNEKDQEKTNAKQNLSQVFLFWEWNFQQLSYLFNGMAILKIVIKSVLLLSGLKVLSYLWQHVQKTEPKKNPTSKTEKAWSCFLVLRIWRVCKYSNLTWNESKYNRDNSS